MKKHNFIIFLGPSGGGKSVLATYLETIGWKKIITATTRDPRIGEINGKDYYFLTEKEFLDADKIEYAKYANNYYGTLVNITNKAIEENDCFIILELNGAIKFKKAYPDAKIIFVYNDLPILEQRMRDRKDNEDKIIEKINYIKEANELDNYKYADVIIKNDLLEESIQLLNSFIETFKN